MSLRGTASPTNSRLYQMPVPSALAVNSSSSGKASTLGMSLRLSPKTTEALLSTCMVKAASCSRRIVKKSSTTALMLSACAVTASRAPASSWKTPDDLAAQVTKAEVVVGSAHHEAETVHEIVTAEIDLPCRVPVRLDATARSAAPLAGTRSMGLCPSVTGTTVTPQRSPWR